MQRIRDAMQVNLKKRNGGDALRIARYAPRRDWVGKSLAAIARDERSDALDIAIEITRHGGASVVSFGMSEEDVRDVMKLPWVATASDGRSSLPGPDKPHPRNNGTFPRKIGYYSIREKVLPLELAIRSASGLPADILGMQDRGYLKPGMYADVTVFDAKTFIDTATFDEPHRYAEGVRYVFVNGVPAVYSGRPTGTLAGRALRRPENNR
jgi:N-acyl-D-aspartate/D-glutamate deacylase